VKDHEATAPAARFGLAGFVHQDEELAHRQRILESLVE
jgi:hypothetical protein